MVALSLKICVRQCNVVKTMQFEPSTAVYDACRVIRERVPEAQTGQGMSLCLLDFIPIFKLGVMASFNGVCCFSQLQNMGCFCQTKTPGKASG